MSFRACLPFAVLLLAAACRTAAPAATPTPEVIADCFWSAEVVAWVDADGSGTREAAEAPLEGVAVNFTLTFYSGAITGADGQATLTGMYPSACDASLANQVVAVAPEGYTPTTELAQTYTDAQKVYEFGFRPAP
ncbi:MAG: hypothetical protein IT317_16970 [Anaerolineales bacterium]|nr:hypothetical protein [Anaerolineales bacterium]